MLADLAQEYSTTRVALRAVPLLLLGTLLVASGAAAQPEDPAPQTLQTAHVCARGTPGPRIDPIAGDDIGRDALSCLPSSRHLGAVLDVWFNRVISQQVGGGGMAFFDPVRLSSHGRSWRQTRFHLNGIDITDPARPGEPLFELPYDAWDGVAYRSLWTARPGVDVSFRAEAPDTWRLTGAAGQDVGGGTWIPGDLFDREPATEHGATAERRRLRAVGELFAERAWRLGATGQLRLIGSFVEHEHRYPTLRANDGRNAVDRLSGAPSLCVTSSTTGAHSSPQPWWARPAGAPTRARSTDGSSLSPLTHRAEHRGRISHGHVLQPILPLSSA